MLAAGSAVRLLSGPLGGRVADAMGQARFLMAAGAALAALAAALYGVVSGFVALLVVNMLMAAAFAPVIPLGDALALRAAREEGWDYGRVRAAGSVAFVAAAGAAGWLAERAGAGSIAWVLAGAFAAGDAGRVGAAGGPGAGPARRRRLPRRARPARVPAAAGGVDADPGQPRGVLRLRVHPLGGGGPLGARSSGCYGRGRWWRRWRSSPGASRWWSGWARRAWR